MPYCLSNAGLPRLISYRWHVGFVDAHRSLQGFAALSMLTWVLRVGRPETGAELMPLRNLFVCTAICTAVIFSASPSWAQGETRFGVWVNSTNPNNVMTYEPYEKGGMKITVSNPSNPANDWSYVTMFDGTFRPVTGQQGSETAVEIINEKSTRIYNKRNGVVNQVVINTLSADNNQINNEYIRMDKDGKITGVTHVTYIRKK
jgi:hypothetical protein